MTSSASSVFISWKYGRLLASDIDCMHSGRWLNDACIEYALEIIRSSSPSSGSIRFVDPSVAFLIAHEDDWDDLQAAVEDLFNGDDKNWQWLVLPVNNNEDPNVACGGDHWTLVLYDRETSNFYHFDSSSSTSGGSQDQVSRLCTKIRNLDNNTAATTSVNLVGVSCAKQGNSYDCGVYVIAFAATIAIHHDSTMTTIGEAVKKIDSSTIDRLRATLLEMVMVKKMDPGDKRAGKTLFLSLDFSS